MFLTVHVNAAEHHPMPDKNPVVIREADVVLEFSFTYSPAQELLKADYQVRNEGTQAVAIFDRGDSIAVATNRHQAGDSVQPMLAREGSRATLSHLALSLPNPAPTVPRISLAAKIDPGASVRGAFAINLPGGISQFRYCLGVAPFNAEDFTALQNKTSVVIWKTAFTVAARQREICSPWFVRENNTFEIH